jgi:integration host factor subunit alpha
MALTKDVLAQLLVKQIGLNGREAREMIERFYGEIAATLEAGESVELADFGEFSVRDVRELPKRAGRKPKPAAAQARRPQRVAEFRPAAKTSKMKSSDGQG